MHSNIIQLSKQPIPEDEWAKTEDFYDGIDDYADYIGEELEGDERTQVLEWLESDDLGGIFELDMETESLIYKGLGTFLLDWNTYIVGLANHLDNIKIDSLQLYKIRKATERTHTDVYSRFYIADWCGYAEPFAELIKYAEQELNIGDRLYIGAIIDFHF